MGQGGKFKIISRIWSDAGVRIRERSKAILRFLRLEDGVGGGCAHRDGNRKGEADGVMRGRASAVLGLMVILRCVYDTRMELLQKQLMYQYRPWASPRVIFSTAGWPEANF